MRRFNPFRPRGTRWVPGWLIDPWRHCPHDAAGAKPYGGPIVCMICGRQLEDWPAILK